MCLSYHEANPEIYFHVHTGKMEFSNWKGTVLTSVVDTFQTQNVTDIHSR